VSDARAGKAWLKSALYHGGALSLGHRLRNRHTLTVAMFHRVLPAEDAAWQTADPSYAVTDGFFERCLGFFQHHYSVIDLATLRAAARGGPPLPPYALLITFDDGWADTLSVAGPILRRHRLPALVFVAVEPMLQPGVVWWQAVVDFVISRQLITDPGCRPLRQLCALDRPLSAPLPGGEPGLHYALLSALAAASESERGQALAGIARTYGFPDPQHGRRQLLQPHQLAELGAFGLAIGAHGFSHLPLTHLRAPADDLQQAHDWLRHTGHGGERIALSFPHGRYSEAILRQAQEIGFEPIFTSDACLNRSTWPLPAALGRISLAADNGTAASGGFAPERLALWLFHRPVSLR